MGEMERILEEIASLGLSESALFENEYYDENDPLNPSKRPSRRNTFKSTTTEATEVTEAEEETETRTHVNDDVRHRDHCPFAKTSSAQRRGAKTVTSGSVRSGSATSCTSSGEFEFEDREDEFETESDTEDEEDEHEESYGDEDSDDGGYCV